LADTTLAELHFTPKAFTRGIDVLRSLKTLKSIGLDDNKRYTTAEFWKRYDAGEFK
jgi:hypothetical protein